MRSVKAVCVVGPAAVAHLADERLGGLDGGIAQICDDPAAPARARIPEKGGVECTDCFSGAK